MYQNLDLFRVSGEMAVHAGKRQATVAANIANADTPGYRATATAPFSETYRSAPRGILRATRPGHIMPDPAPRPPGSDGGRAEPAPNGNSVSLEREMLHSIDAAREHSRALAIYRHTMTIIRSSIGPGK